MGALWWRSSSSGRRCLYLPGEQPGWMDTRADGTEPLVGDWDWFPFVRPYSTSIADAWTVVEKMRERTGFLLDDQDIDGRPWFASFTCDEHAEPGERGTTAPLAICRAALKAVAATSAASEAPNV